MQQSQTTRQEVRDRLCAAIAARGVSYRKRTIDRAHLFYTVLKNAMRSGVAADRIYYAYEFALIEKVVNAAQAGNLTASRAWRDEAARARRGAAGAVTTPNALDVLLYPAIALIAFAEADPGEAHRLLDHADRCLLAYLAEGGGDAGVAVLEQKLNRLRCHAKFSPPDVFADFAAEFILGAIGHPRGPAWSGRDLISSFAEERSNVELCYVDAALLRALVQLDAPEFTTLLRRLAEQDEPGGRRSAVLAMARLCIALLEPDERARREAQFLDHDLLERAPATLMTVLDALTDGGPRGGGDALTTALSTYEDRGRVERAAHTWLRGQSSRVTADDRELLPAGGC